MEQIFVIKLETEERMDPLMMANDLSEYMGYFVTEVKEIIIEEPEEVKGCSTCIYEDDYMIRDIGEVETCTAMHKPKEGKE